MGDEILDEHIMAASHQHNHRKALLESHRATPLEVLASKKRKTGLLLESVSTVPIGPDWAQAILQGMNERLTENTNTLRLVNERLTENTNTLRLTNVRVDQMELSLIQLSIQTARNTNRSLSPREIIALVPNPLGVLPRDGLFPRTQTDIVSMLLREVDELLTFYNIVPNQVTHLRGKKAILVSHLGFNQLAVTF